MGLLPRLGFVRPHRQLRVLRVYFRILEMFDAHGPPHEIHFRLGAVQAPNGNDLQSQAALPCQKR